MVKLLPSMGGDSDQEGPLKDILYVFSVVKFYFGFQRKRAVKPSKLGMCLPLLKLQKK